MQTDRVSDISTSNEIEPAWLWCQHDGHGPSLGLAVHAGHDIRPGLVQKLNIDEASRLREEDPYTDFLSSVCSNRIYTRRSRFEVDLNRGIEDAICFEPDDCWGLNVWDGHLSEEDVQSLRSEHSAFYRMYRKTLDRLVARYGKLIVFDVHSYNHQRKRGQPADQCSNPDINIGTGSLNTHRWRGLIDVVMDAFRTSDVRGQKLDVRENVNFRGREIAAVANQAYPESACAIAIEVKKTFMDEWTGEIDAAHLRDLHRSFEDAVSASHRWIAHHG